MKILVTDELSKEGIEMLTKDGVQVDVRPKISQEDLIKIIGDYEALIVRSGTKGHRAGHRGRQEAEGRRARRRRRRTTWTWMRPPGAVYWS